MSQVMLACILEWLLFGEDSELTEHREYINVISNFKNLLSNHKIAGMFVLMTLVCQM